MSAPMIWIGVPLALAALGWVLRRWPRLQQGILAGGSIFLALLSWQLRIDDFTQVGPWTVKVEATQMVFGRNFTLPDSERGLLTFVFLFLGIWLLGMRMSGLRPVAAISATSIAGLLIAARAVEPFLFSALLIEVAVLFSLPALAHNRHILNPAAGESGNRRSFAGISPGVLRYLIFQTLALPFVLIAGWAATEVEFLPENQQLILVAAGSLALGLAFWLAAFPFYTWVPMLFAEANPFFAVLIMVLLPLLALYLLIDFINTFEWLRNLPQLTEVLRLVAIVMVASSGIWAAFERNIYRMLGYAFVLENGLALLAISISATPEISAGGVTGLGYNLFNYSVYPRVAAVGLAALALSILRGAELEGKVKGAAGLMRRYPMASLAFLLSILSLSGFPLLAGFPLRQALYESLARQVGDLSLVLWPFLASIGLMLGGLRSLLVFVGAKTDKEKLDGLNPTSDSQPLEWKISETRWQIVLLGVGIFLLVVIGLFPGIFFPG